MRKRLIAALITALLTLGVVGPAAADPKFGPGNAGGAPGAVFGFRLEQLVLGTDNDGDPITSCVVVEADAPAKAVRLSDRTKLTLDTLVNLIAIEGEKLPQGTRFPSGGHRLGVKLSGFRREFYNRVMSGTEPDTASKAFQRERERLQRLRLIQFYDDWVWWTGQPGQHRTR